MALRTGVSVGIQTVARATSPTPISTQHVKNLVWMMADTTQRVRNQHDSIRQCWEKLSVSEQLAANMMDKIIATTRRVENLNEKLHGTKTAVVKKQKLCGELRQMIDYSKSKLTKSGQASMWTEFHTSEIDKKIADNTRWIDDYNRERVKYQNKLRSIVAELNTVRYQLEDADESVRYIETFRDRMEQEHVHEMRGLQLAIKEAYVTRNSMMSAKPDAMVCVVRQLLPDDEDYDQLVAETEDLNEKCITLKVRLNEQSKEMLHYHSRNHELSLKIKELITKVTEAQEQRMPQQFNVNAHAQTWNKRPVTWFETPNVSMEKVKDFLMKTHGKDSESRVIQYLEVKAAGEARWHSQMFEKDFVEYERTLDILAEQYSSLKWEKSSKAEIRALETKDAYEELLILPVTEKTQSQITVELSHSELQLCAAAAQSVEPVVVDDIGKIEKSTRVTSRRGFFRRVHTLFKR